MADDHVLPPIHGESKDKETAQLKAETVDPKPPNRKP